jgi:hypothetical protein
MILWELERVESSTRKHVPATPPCKGLIPWCLSTPAENLLSKFFFFFIFLDTDPHLASVVCDPLSLFRFEIRVVCVWELVYVCACEHKFGVTTNHGKF